MIIGERLRQLREEKKLSQREVEERSGLLRAYLSPVENGHTIPTVETLQKWAKALEVPMYQLFYEGNQPPEPSTSSMAVARRKRVGQLGRGRRRSEATSPAPAQNRRAPSQNHSSTSG